LQTFDPIYHIIMDLRMLMFLFAAFSFGSAGAFRRVRRHQAGKLIAGVPVHNYHLRSAALLEVNQAADARSDWIVMLKSAVSQDQLESFCSNSGGICTPEGHAGILPFVELHGTEAELKELVEAHSSEVEYVEPDLATHLIPEMPSTQSTVTLYMPISLNGIQVLFHQSGSKWLVSDQQLGGGYVGLSWRNSKDNNDRADDYVAWGTVLENGVDEQDGWVRFEVKPTVSWGLDRVGVEKAATKGKGAHIYVLDTGVRTTHSDFGGRAIPTLEYLGTSPTECQGSTSCARDVHGHGTHCAGTVGGTKYGVAPESTIHGVKVLSDGGSGSTSWIVGAIDWVVAKGERPAVISMSLGGPGVSNAYKTAIDAAANAGVTMVVAGGNSNADACNFSPAFVNTAITVGSTAKGDSRSSFSNYGSCTQIYAPGSDIKSAGNSNDDASATMSGTSMACPHVAGAAALLLESTPTMAPSEVLEKMLENAVTNALTGLSSSCPNKLLYVGADAL
jgi:hypothetical protein